MMLLNSVWLWSTLYLGISPGHYMSMYKIPDHQEWLNVNQTCIAEYLVFANIAQYFEIYGGITTFSFKTGDGLDFYPIRSDYKIGLSAKYKFVKISYDYGCYHPIAPLCSSMPLPKIDASQQRVGIELQIGKAYIQK